MTRYPHTTWQQRRWSSASRRWVRIVGGLGLLLGLGALFGHTLLVPFAQPQVHVFVLSGEIASDLWPEALSSVRPSPAASTLFPLVQTWTDSAKLPSPQLIAGLASGQTLDDMVQTAESPPIRPGDVAIAVVQSQLATIDGTLFLVDRLNPRDPQRGRVPFDKFLDAFRSSTAGTKLLCLDAGQLSADPRSGMSINDFGEPLRKAVESTGDPRLWVLVSHRPGECSQVVEGHPPTIFLDAVVRGLQHEANQNRDQQISLAELVDFVQRQAAGENHRTGIFVAQTPWLLHGGGVWAAPQLETVLTPLARLTPATPAATLAKVDAAAVSPDKPQPSAPAPTDAAKAATAQPVTSMTVPELLQAAWELRDQLEQAAPNSPSSSLRPRDFAPFHWNRLQSELVQAESLWRCQPAAFPPRIHTLLQIRVNDLRALAGANNAAGSEWLKNVQQLQPRPAGELNASVSLSMAEQWHRWTLTQPSERDIAERTTLQELLTATDPQAFLKWGESKPEKLHGELQFARLFSSLSGQEWLPTQQALRVRSTADALTCHPIAVRWFAGDLLRGDRLRWYGERKLSDPVQTEDSATAQQTLREASAVYQQVAAATERVVAAEQLKADLLTDLPHWMALSRNHSLTIRPSLSAELLHLIGDLAEFIELLANARSQDCGRLEQLRHGLQRRRDRVETLIFPEGVLEPFGRPETSSGELRSVAWALLETPLPTATQRQTLQKWLTVAAATQTSLPTAEGSVDDPLAGPLEPDHELESCFARLLQPLQRQPDREQAQPERWAFPPMISDKAAACCQACVILPGELRKHLKEPIASDHSAAIAWRHTFWLIDPRDEIPVNIEHSLTALLLDDMQRVIHWQWQQATMAQSDATAQEFTRLQEQVDHLSAILTNSFGGLRPAAAKDIVRVSSPNQMDLAATPEQMLLLTVQNPQRVATQVRYVVEYDPELLQVATTSEHCQFVPQVPRADRHIWPYEPTHPTTRTCTLPVEGQDELLLRVRGHQAEGPTRLVVHVVTDRSSLRQDIVVNLPLRPLATVQVKASRNEGLVLADQQLRPFGNRSTSFHFLVQGLRRDTTTLDITACRVTTPAIDWPTATTLPTVDLQRWLGQTAGIEEVATLPGVAVKTDSAVPVRFPVLKPEANVSLDLSGGLLIIMRDAARQLSTWQHLPCTPLRPAAYVDATVQYEESRELLRIVVRPRDELEIPAEGIPVRCRIVKHTDQASSTPLRWESAPAHSVSGMLQTYQREFMLNLPWRSPAERAVVLIDVDDWSRAFVFKVEPDGVRRSDEFAVEILEPQRQSAIRAPVPVIPVTVAVTIPPRFIVGENFIEVGVDRNGDRRLEGEPTLRLPTDRQTGVVLDSIDATGIWTLKTSVRDWQISVPTASLSDQWGTVLARIARGPHEVWSEGTAVAFDKEGPRLSRIDLSGNGELAVGQSLQITMRADDHELSGVASVSAGIDQSGLGIISPNTVMVPAKADGEDGWSVTLPTEKLTPGPYVVVIQATDLVGNPGPVSVVPIRCLTAEEVAARAAVPVQGQVQYAGEAIREAEVRLTAVPPKDASPTTSPPKTLTTKTNRSGQFSFDSVVPGQYDLIATGTVRGFRYESRTKVTVAPGKESAPLQLVFGQKAR